MSPRLEDHEKPDSSTEDIEEHLARLSLSSSSVSEATTSSSEAESTHATPIRRQEPQGGVDLLFDHDINFVPLEQNLKELLLKVSGTEDLESLTQIKLRVIAREVSLQQLGCYMPSLRELILDGSVISSLRDLGSGLRNLTVLKVNKCQLPCIDGVFGFDSLEELYAADNDIKDISPCAFLTCLKVLDVRRNDIKHITALSFIGLCQDLEHLYIEGNVGVTQFPRYRQAIKTFLPGLKSLDGVKYTLDEMVDTAIDTELYLAQNPDIMQELQDNAAISDPISFTPEMTRSSLLRNRPSPRNPSERFTVSFAPRVFSADRTNPTISDIFFLRQLALPIILSASSERGHNGTASCHPNCLVLVLFHTPRRK